MADVGDRPRGSCTVELAADSLLLTVFLSRRVTSGFGFHAGFTCYTGENSGALLGDGEQIVGTVCTRLDPVCIAMLELFHSKGGVWQWWRAIPKFGWTASCAWGKINSPERIEPHRERSIGED